MQVEPGFASPLPSISPKSGSCATTAGSACSRFCPLHAWAVAIVYWMALLVLSAQPRHSGNVTSRYMTIESVVERGTLAVEGSPMLPISGSPDIVRVGPHVYSDKPPLLSVLSASVYAPLHAKGKGFTPDDFLWVNLALVSLVVGTSSALALASLRSMLQMVPASNWVADLLALSCGLGTLLLSYGVTFNNHSVAAGLLTAALALVLLEPAGSPRLKVRRILTGVLAGAAAAIDIPAGGAMLLGLGLWLASRSRRTPWGYLAAAAVPMLVHAVLQTLTSGTPFPVEMTPELLEQQGSYWASEAGRYREVVPRWQWGLELLFGPQGWLTLSPVLVLGLLGLTATAFRRLDPLRPAALVVGGVVVLLLAFYIWGVRRTDFAGLSFGTRHMLAVTPAVYFFAAVIFLRARSRLVKALFVVLLVAGLVYAWKGMIAPWTRIEQRTSSDPILAFLQKGTLYPWSSYNRLGGPRRVRAL
jgi:hypothetical protein